jgi:hypothetical protein
MWMGYAIEAPFNTRFPRLELCRLALTEYGQHTQNLVLLQCDKIWQTLTMFFPEMHLSAQCEAGIRWSLECIDRIGA